MDPVTRRLVDLSLFLPQRGRLTPSFGGGPMVIARPDRANALDLGGEYFGRLEYGVQLECRFAAERD